MSKSRKLDFDLSNLDVDMQLRVFEHLKEYARQEAIAAEADQLLAAQENERTTKRAIDGVGPQVLAISPLAYIHFKAIEELDFANKREIKWLCNRYPEMKVRSTGTKLQVSPGFHSNRRSVKNYGRI